MMTSEQRLERLVGTWFVAAAAAGGLPALEDISPRAFADVLRWTSIVAVETPIGASRMIQFGTGMVDVVGRDWTGHTLGAIDFGRVRETIFSPYAQAIDLARPLMIREARRAHGDRWRMDWRLILPCGTRRSGGALTRLLVFVLFDRRDDALSWSHTIDEWRIIEHRPYFAPPDLPVAPAGVAGRVAPPVEYHL